MQSQEQLININPLQLRKLNSKDAAAFAILSVLLLLLCKEIIIVLKRRYKG
jgi:hypothetical protein